MPVTIYNPRVLRARILAGQDETMDDTITLVAMAATDQILAVCMLDAAYLMVEWRNDDFSAGAGAINVEAHAVDTTGLFYLVIYDDIP